jgi:aminoglycoside/choline kinase family phosphotransferase
LEVDETGLLVLDDDILRLEIAMHEDAGAGVQILGDFQSQNIVIKDEKACFIDFQGMRPGLVQYDLASLLYDPYVPLMAAERAELLDYYLDGWSDLGGEIPANFSEIYDLCAMQRLMQALGAYGFLGLVKERPHFLEHIPAALGSLQAVVARVSGLDSLSEFLGALPVAARD